MELTIGINAKNRKKIVEILTDFLADTYVLYVKTQSIHWNIEGPAFIGLHLLLQKQYENLAEAADEIAERIRSLGHYAPGSLAVFVKRSSLPEETKALPWRQMMQRLVKAHEWMASNYREWIPGFQKLGDEISADMLIQKIAYHEKQAYLLRSHLGK